MFIPYKDINGDSNVKSFEIGPNYIAVIFNNTNIVYTYSYARAGQFHVENMKRLAETGDGLNAYIKKYCNKLYDK